MYGGWCPPRSSKPFERRWWGVLGEFDFHPSPPNSALPRTAKMTAERMDVPSRQSCVSIAGTTTTSAGIGARDLRPTASRSDRMQVTGGQIERSTGLGGLLSDYRQAPVAA